MSTAQFCFTKVPPSSTNVGKPSGKKSDFSWFSFLMGKSLSTYFSSKSTSSGSIGAFKQKKKEHKSVGDGVGLWKWNNFFCMASFRSLEHHMMAAPWTCSQYTFIPKPFSQLFWKQDFHLEKQSFYSEVLKPYLLQNTSCATDSHTKDTSELRCKVFAFLTRPQPPGWDKPCHTSSSTSPSPTWPPGSKPSGLPTCTVGCCLAAGPRCAECWLALIPGSPAQLTWHQPPPAGLGTTTLWPGGLVPGARYQVPVLLVSRVHYCQVQLFGVTSCAACY